MTMIDEQASSTSSNLKTPINIYTSNSYEKEHFIKFAKFISSTELLIITNDNHIEKHSYQLTSSLLFSFIESNYIYDYDILPNDSNESQSLLFICSKDNPIRALSLFDGEIKETYLLKNHLDQIINPIFLSINQFSLNLYCGGTFLSKIDLITNKQISIKVPSKQMLSCSSSHYLNSAYLVGSYDKQILQYDTRTDKLCELYEMTEAVNQIKFSLKEPNCFYVGFRNSNSVKLFDWRMMGQHIGEWYRNAKSSQRISFEIDDDERYLFSGNVDGSCLGYDLNEGRCWCYFMTEKDGDCVNSVDYNDGILLTATGQRHFVCDDGNEELNNDDNGGIVKDCYKRSCFQLWKFS